MKDSLVSIVSSDNNDLHKSCQSSPREINCSRSRDISNKEKYTKRQI